MNACNFATQEKDIHIWFRTSEMDVPKFFYQKNDKYPNEVAVMA